MPPDLLYWPTSVFFLVVGLAIAAPGLWDDYRKHRDDYRRATRRHPTKRTRP